MKNLNINEILESLNQSAGMEKVAGEVKTDQTLPVAEQLQTILEKKAEQDVSSQAFKDGEELAKQLLEKLANEVITDNAIMASQDDKKIVPTETAGSVEQVLAGTVGQALDRGATSDDRVDDLHDKGRGPMAGDEINKQATEEINQEKKAEQTTENQEIKEMANEIMKKIAQVVGEATTTPAAASNVEGAPVPNMVQMDNASMTSYDDQKVQPLPGAEGTINNILEAIVANAKTQGGAGSDDLVNGEGPVEGAAAIGVKAAEENDEVEKAAAVSALVEAGCGFNDAVELVKQAERELFTDSLENEKQAAFSALVEEGIDFDTATSLVKQAEEDLWTERNRVKTAGVASAAKEMASKAWGAVKGDASKLPGQLDNVRHAIHNNGGVFNKGVGSTVKAVAKNKALQLGVGGVAAAGVGAGLAMRKKAEEIEVEKVAAFTALIQEGVDFDTATTLISQAEREIYGE
jgi:hypothetical protein